MAIQWATTERLAARVTLAEGMVIHGDLHLQGRVAHREGPETPIEMLNRPEAFFPVSLASGGVVFVSKAQVAVVAYQLEGGANDTDRRSAAQHIHLEVMMSGGAEFRGVAETELPPNRSRPLDYLNGREQFFDLCSDDMMLCLNRAHVRVARPVN